MTYLFLGPPASGKGTQAQLLAQTIHLPFFSIGAMLRQNAKQNPEIDQRIDSGQLVSDEIVITLLKHVIDEHPDGAIVLDGAIRTTAQVDTLLTIWSARELRIFLIDIPDTEILARAAARIEAGQKRDDDAVAIVKARIHDYRNSIAGIIEHIKQHNIQLVRIDGMGTAADIHRQIMEYAQ